MSDTETQHEKKVSSIKKRVKRTVTLYTEEGRFECPIVATITGRIHDRVMPILEEYENALGHSVPDAVAQMNALTGEEREKYAQEHADEIGAYVRSITGAMARLKSGDASATPGTIAAARRYTLKMLRAILDPSKIETPENAQELIDSEIDSDFWRDQDLEEARDHVGRFRRRLA